MVSFILIDAAAIAAVAVGTVIYVAFMLRVNIRQAPSSSPAAALQQLPPPPPPRAFNESPSRMQNVIERVKEIIHPTPTDVKIKQLTTVARQHAERFGKMNEQIRELKSAIALTPDPPAVKKAPQAKAPVHLSSNSNQAKRQRNTKAHASDREDKSGDKEDADWKITEEPKRKERKPTEDADWKKEQEDK